MGNKRYLRLKCGQNPDEPGGGKGRDAEEWKKNGATFSRFVLPFAYWDRDYKGKVDTLWFEPAEDSLDPPLQSDLLLERKKYFSYETRRVLFDDALWLQVPEYQWNKSTWANGACFTNSQNFEKKTFCIKMSRPRMVLFGWNAEDRKPGLLQTGFLLVDIWFPEGQDVILDDILCLNDLFRCFDYPGYERHWEYYKEALSDIPVKYQGKPSKVERIGHLKDDERYRAYIERWTGLLELPVKIEDHYYSLVPQDLTARVADWLRTMKAPSDADDEHPSNFLVYNDFRTYVWSGAVLKEGGGSISRFCHTGQSAPWEFGHWVKFLNIDPPSFRGPSYTARDVSDFEKDWARQRTYDRWLHYGTWYGFNYHSGVTVQGPDIYLKHFRNHYFDIILLLFYLRVTLFRFSNRLSQACSNCRNLEGQKERFKKLRNDFSRFTILYQFPLLSNQQQAIEMYSLARKHFDIQDFYREVKSEIDNTHEYLEMVEANKLATAANWIAKAGIPIGMAALVASLFGMNDMHVAKAIFNDHFLDYDPEFWVLFFIVLLVFGLSYFFIEKKLGKHGDGGKNE